MRESSMDGFTLLEVLVTLIIMALTLSIVFPKMFPMLGASEKRVTVRRIIEKVNKYHWKAFEEKKMIFIYENEGVLTAKMGDKTRKIWSPKNGVSLVMSDALVCMPNGAVNGVTMRIDFKASSFYVDFSPFDGEVTVTEGK